MTDRRDCAEESLAVMSHMRVSPSVGETPQQQPNLFELIKFGQEPQYPMERRVIATTLDGGGGYPFVMLQ